MTRFDRSPKYFSTPYECLIVNSVVHFVVQSFKGPQASLSVGFQSFACTKSHHKPQIVPQFVPRKSVGGALPLRYC